MNAGFFGAPDSQRFYAHHEPADLGGRPRAVLLCNPGPQEYRQCHWVLRQLAERLANAGAHVLRFDYMGTGDSSGNVADGSLVQWVDDVHDAAEELRALAGVSRVTVVGIRLGAAIAWRAAQAGVRMHDLVLWDPVVQGTRYLTHLEEVQERIRLDQAYPISDAVDPGVLLGVAMTATQRAELETLNLLREPMPAPTRVTLFSAEPDHDASALAARCEADAIPATLSVLADASLTRPVWHEDTLLARVIPSAILEHVTGTGR